MHNGFVNVDKEKMSKSLGNFFTIREVLKKYDAEVVRFFILRAHYRSPLNYSDAHLDDARGALTRLYTALKLLPAVRPELVEGSARTDAVDWNEAYAQRFQAAMDDDFNTPEAVAVLFDLANEVNKTNSQQLASQFKALAGVLGLLQRDAQEFLQGRSEPTVGITMTGDIRQLQSVPATFGFGNIQQLIDERQAAKQAKNYVEADRIRKELLAAGIALEDSAAGTTWRRA
jgi:cysteinyl-tRNA synthetase